MLDDFSGYGIQANEEERLRAVRYYDVYEPGSEAALRNLVELIAEDFDVPVAAITLVGSANVLLKASVGLSDAPTLDRSIAFCSLTVLSDEITVFEDTRIEPLLRDNPLVHGEAGLLFYAAVPLITPDDFRIGTVFLSSYACRQFTAQERQRLKRFARCVMHELELMATIRQRKAKAEEKELQLKQAFRMAGVGSWEFDMETKTSIWSDELFELYGVDKKEAGDNLLGLYMSMIHPEDLQGVEARLHDPEAFGESVMERIIRPDGTVLCLHQLRKKIYDAEGRLIKILGIAQDITKRMAYEEKLKASEERFKALVQNSSDMIAVLDENGIIKYVSPSSEAISGYAPEELTGCNVFEFIYEDDMAILMEELGKVASSTNSGEPTLHRFRAKSGRWIWLESVGMNRMNDAHIGGIIINARNVTERIRLEEQLAVEQKNLQRAVTSAVIKAQETERSELGRELHDNINQVLTTVKLYTEMIKDGIGDQRELVQKSTQHLQSCIDEIRSISKRLSAPTLGDIGLEDSIKELVESINLTNRVEIIFSSQNLHGLKISQELHLAVYRIIQENLNNIIKYAAASLVTISLKYENDQLMLVIIDNGKGFDVKAKRGGIGLTNMRARAENLGGFFNLASEKGKGCRLDVRFPLQVKIKGVSKKPA